MEVISHAPLLGRLVRRTWLTSFPSDSWHINRTREPIIDATFAEYVVFTKRPEEEDMTWLPSDRATAIDFAIHWLMGETDKAEIG